MRMYFSKKIGAVLLVVAFAGCGKFTFPYISEVEPQTKTYAIDAVKLISPTEEASESSHSQSQFTLSPERRLLLRFESFDEHANQVDLSKGKTISLVVHSADPLAKNVLNVCPLTRTWMMLATWRFAHPFNSSGQWLEAGGDFDSVICQKAGAQSAEGAVSFDVKNWYRFYVEGMSANHGLLLMADRDVVIAGDLAGALAPRLAFDEFATSEGTVQFP